MIEYQEQHKLMGCLFSLGVSAPSTPQAKKWVKAGVTEIQRIEALLSEFKPNSEVSLINTSEAFTPVSICSETFQLLKRCEALSRMTKGDFDITTAPLKALYPFKNESFSPPTPQNIKKALESVGQEHLDLSVPNTLRLLKPQMKISFASIGKGYAADRVKALWQKLGVPGGFVNSSGDLSTFGQRPNGKAWTVGISDPDQPEKILLNIPLQNRALATSGDYQQHFMHQGKRYSHTLNPKTGKPTTGIKSVSVVAPSAELADALATALFVKGVQKGLAFVNQLPQTHAIFIDDKNKIHLSKHLHYETLEAVA